jgi:hypothetical protein
MNADKRGSERIGTKAVVTQRAAQTAAARKKDLHRNDWPNELRESERWSQKYKNRKFF